MNEWTKKSVEYAKNKDYLDQLFKVYTISRNPRRPLSDEKRKRIKDAIENKKYKELILACIDSEVFPIKDSYVGFLRKDKTSIDRNPETVNRIAGALIEMGYEEVIAAMERPAETNRQMGTVFTNWIDKGILGIKITKDREEFLNSSENMILNTNDKDRGEFARIYLGYGRNRGLDFLCRYNGKYIIGEAKFITNSGGNQGNQLDSAMTIFTSIKTTTKYEVIPIAILDGILYLEGNNQMYQTIKRNNNDVMSALFLRDFIYQL